MIRKKPYILNIPRNKSEKQMQIANVYTYILAFSFCFTDSSVFYVHVQFVCITFVLIMSPPNKCCNPLKKKKHTYVIKNLTYISENYDKNFSALYGLYICASCKGQLYRNKDLVQFVNKSDLINTNLQQVESEKEEEEEEEEEKEIKSKLLKKDDDREYVCKSVDNKNKRLKLAAALEEVITALPANKKQITLSDNDTSFVLKSIGVSTMNNCSEFDVNAWIGDFKEALSRASNRNEKFTLLTTIPVKWSIRKIAKEFNISRRIVSAAFRLRDSQGYATCRDKKKGRAMSEELIEKVKDFYLSDDVSRVMPGIKDVKSVVINGKRELKTKRLLLGDIQTLHNNFLNLNPEVQISLSAFQVLRPQECITVGAKGTHNVCVCKTHGNIRLKLKGLKEAFAYKKVEFKTNYHDYLKDMTCINPTAECYLGNCTNCPRTLQMIKNLKSSLQNHKIKTICYNQWLTTDRCQLISQTETNNLFTKNLEVDLPDVLKHDFIAKSQAAYLQSLKQQLKDFEFIVTLDFSENYSFHVQDAIQSQHWSKEQASLHVYVIHYKKNNSIYNINYVVLSDYENHDAVGVHLYNSKMIKFLKKKFGSRNVRKIFYFSDGAGSQYKNRFNLLNLLYHEIDFGVKAEWHFFATAHGKGACDGIGGCVKRSAYRASLQDQTIVTTKKLYEWACIFFKKINFDYSSLDEYEKHKTLLQPRFSTAKTIKGTRQYHCFKPIDLKSLDCKIISDHTKSVVEKVCK